MDGDHLAVFVAVESTECISELMEAFSSNEVCGNRILDSAIIGVDEGQGFQVFHPEGFTGAFGID